jgi:NAD(P)-dependent dehydrogenase (short-subunit alcohol dehydrogenase family)
MADNGWRKRMDELEGRVAVVTGGASGIGRAMAARFRAAGMRVVIADVEAAVLERTAGELGVEGIVTDVSDPASVHALADAVLARHGAVHLVCNNAGVGGQGPMASLTLKDWQWVIGVNLWGVVHGVQAFLPILLGQGQGHIVNTASVAGLCAHPSVPGPYTASKYAVVGLSECLRNELAGTGVGVSVVCPGFVRTNIGQSQRNRPEVLRNPTRSPAAQAMHERIQEQLEDARTPPEDVASAVHDAVVADRFWVITHPELLGLVDQRHTELMAARPGG